MSNKVSIEVAFAGPGRQEVKAMTVPSGTTIGEAVRQSGLMDEFPSDNLENAPKGIFGRLRQDDWIVEENDRVEIYRPLQIDPREARRRRARSQS